MNLLKNSIKVIEKLQLRNGAILATFKNDAYPYVYPRDASIMTKALNLHGLYKKSEKFYNFLTKVQRDHYIDQRYQPNGLPFVTQRGERDASGLVLQGIWDTYEKGLNKKFLEKMWPSVKWYVDCCESSIERGLVLTRRSIHEYIPLENGYEIWANSAVCKGLYDASKIAKELEKKESINWEKKARKLETNIKRKLFHKRLGIYVKNLKRNGKTITAPDISMLSPFYFGIDNSQRVLKKTLHVLRKNLWHKLGGFLRFESFKICDNWHWYTGGDGPFTALTIIAARFFKQTGDKKHFKECYDWINKVHTKGHFPERFSWKKDYELWKQSEWEFSERILKGMKRSKNIKPSIPGTVYWATPLGWAHAEYIFLEAVR